MWGIYMPGIFYNNYTDFGYFPILKIEHIDIVINSSFADRLFILFSAVNPIMNIIDILTKKILFYTLF